MNHGDAADVMGDSDRKALLVVVVALAAATYNLGGTLRSRI
jgi:hypothetical protein